MHNVSALLTQATQRYEQARTAFSEQARKYYPDYDKLPSEMPKSMLESYLWSSGTAAALSKITGGNSSHAFRYGIMGAVGCLIDVVLRNEINKRLPSLSSTTAPSYSSSTTPNLSRPVSKDLLKVKETWTGQESPEMVSRVGSPVALSASNTDGEEQVITTSSTEDLGTEDKQNLCVAADPFLVLKTPSFQNAALRTVAVVGGLHILNMAFGDSIKVVRVFVNIVAVLAVTAYQTNLTFTDKKATPLPFL